MKQSTELLDTAYEGLQHMQKLFKEGKFEDTIPLFTNIVQATSSIESAIETLPKELLSDGIAVARAKVIRALDIVVELYESMNFGKIQEVLQFTLIPNYKTWIQACDTVFQRYLLS